MEEKNIALLGFVSSAADYLKEQIKDDSEEIKTLEEVDLNKIKSELENKLGSSFDGAKNKSDDLINAGREVFDNFISKSPTLIDEFKDIFDVDFKKENDEKDEKIVSHLINILKKPQENDETDELVNQIAKAASETTSENKPKVEANNTNEDKELDSIFSEILANENVEEEPIADSTKSEENNTTEEVGFEPKDEEEEPKLDPDEIKQLIKDTISEFFIDKKQEAEIKLDEVIDSFDVLKNAVEHTDTKKEETKEGFGLIETAKTKIEEELEQIDSNPTLEEDNELEEVEYEELNPNNDSLLDGVFKRVDLPQEIEEPVVEENATIEDVFVDDEPIEEENEESLDLELEDDDLKLAASELEDEVNNEQTSDSLITVDDILGSFNVSSVDENNEINSALKDAEQSYLVNYETSYEELPKKEIKNNTNNYEEEIVLNDFNIEEAIEKEFLEIQNRKAEIEETKKTNDDDYSFVGGVLVSEAELEGDLNPVQEESETVEEISKPLVEEETETVEEAELVDEELNTTEENAIEEAETLSDALENNEEQKPASSSTDEEVLESVDETEELETDEDSADSNSEIEELEDLNKDSEELETSSDETDDDLNPVDENSNSIEDEEPAEENSEDFDEAEIDEQTDSSLEKEEPEDLADLETLDLIFEELSKEHENDSNPIEETELEEESEAAEENSEEQEASGLDNDEVLESVDETEDLSPVEELHFVEKDYNELSNDLAKEVEELDGKVEPVDSNLIDEESSLAEEVELEEELEAIEETSDDVSKNSEEQEEAVVEEDLNSTEEAELIEELETIEETFEPVTEEELDSNEEENVSINGEDLDEEFSYDDSDNDEELSDEKVEEDNNISLFDDVPLSQKLSSFTDQYEASDNPYSKDVDYPVDKDDYAFEIGSDDNNDSISSFLKELKENKEQDFRQQANDIVADLIDQCKTLCPDIKEEEPEVEENEPIMIDNDYIEAYNNRTLEEMYIPNPGLDALESEIIEETEANEDSSLATEETEDAKQEEVETETDSNEDAYLNDLFADFTSNDYEVDEVSAKQKQEEAKKKEIYDSIVALYPYLSNGFIKGVYDLKQSFANDYKDGEKIVILHRLHFEDIDGLRQFVDVMINHGYLVNVDEKQMIVDTFKEHVNSDGKILTDIFEIANQGKLLTGDYEGYRIIEDEL